MWDLLGGRDAPMQQRTRSRSRSPRPPMRMPSPGYAQQPPQEQYNYPSYGGQVTPYTSPTYGQFFTQDISRGRSSSPHFQAPASTHVVHVIHHTTHKSHKRHSHSQTRPKTPVPTPISHSSQYQNDDYYSNYTYGQLSPMVASMSHQTSSTVAFPMPTPSAAFQPPPRGVHFSYSEPVQVPTQRTLLKKPRPRTQSQSQSQAHVYHSSHVQPQAHAYENYPSSYAQPVQQQKRPSHSHSHSHSHSNSRPNLHASTSSRPAKLTYVPQPSAAGQHPAFEYSKCNGRRRALCIGINYLGQTNELRGCINDAKHVREFLRKQGGYRSREIMLLTDDASDPRLHPTRTNILAGMRWLVQGSCQNDALFLHYSGHGGQTPDLDGDEADGFDEVIYPVDFKSQGHITDDEMHEIMVTPLVHGCRLTALFDACHSGTVLDLPYIYSSHGRLKGAHVSPRWLQKKSTPADVISWSGCADEQTSADTFQGGVAVGAMSHAFISALKTQPVQTYQQLLTSVRHILNPRYSQKPQLGSSHHIDTNLQFVF